MDGLILTIDNKLILNHNKLRQIFIKDIDKNKLINLLSKLHYRFKEKLVYDAIKKYIENGYLEWGEFTKYNHVCYCCNNNDFALEYIDISQDILFVCFKCRSYIDGSARKIIMTEGKIEYNNFIQKCLYLNYILQINDIIKYTSLMLFESYIKTL